MFLDLLQTTAVVEEAPADEIESTSELAAELLWTLHVGNLLEQLVLGVEIREFQTGKLSTVTYLVDPVNSLLSRTVDLVLALGSTEQHVGVTHHTEVDTIVQTCHHLVVKTCAEVGVLGNGQTTIVVVGYDVIISSHSICITDISKLKAVPVGLVSTDSPVEAGIKLTAGSTLLLEEVIEPGRSREVSPATIVTRTEVTLDSRALCSVGTSVHWRPLIVGTLSTIVEELYLKEALGIVLIL